MAENVNKQSVKDYPYTCFVESSGLLVAISNSGYCCKFSIELQSEISVPLTLRRSGFNSVRSSNLSPNGRKNSVGYSQVSLSQSLA